jgi:hypothetical protein
LLASAFGQSILGLVLLKKPRCKHAMRLTRCTRLACTLLVRNTTIPKEHRESQTCIRICGFQPYCRLQGTTSTLSTTGVEHDALQHVTASCSTTPYEVGGVQSHGWRLQNTHARRGTLGHPYTSTIQKSNSRLPALALPKDTD